jgi:hypothetical protein
MAMSNASGDLLGGQRTAKDGRALILTTRAGARTIMRPRRCGDLVHCRSDLGEELLAFCRQADLPDEALEEDDAQMLLQAPDLPAHSPVRHVQFGGRAREARVLCCHQEGGQGVEWR